jgi:hypothetical protein
MLYPTLLMVFQPLVPNFDKYRSAILATIALTLYGGRFRSDPEFVRIYTELARAPGSLGYYWQLLASAGWTSIPWIHCLRQPP